MALAWIIGLGPVGWIIGGVTLAVIAAVAAWKTNFGGFRDWVMGWVQKLLPLINKVRAALNMPPITLDVIDKTKTGSGMGDLKMLEYQKPPVVNANQPSNDNRQYQFLINSTDPKEAAKEVNSILGGPDNMDKYTRSRDPRLQEPDPVFAW
jgi:hypothetical protein